jgi:shikimate dehydrogenase
MPLKQHVLPLLDEASPLVHATGAANTVLLAGGRRVGHNTDVHGIVAALAEAGVTEVTRSVVLGGGATAASALAALAELGDPEPHVLVRDLGRAGPVQEAAARLGTRVRLGLLQHEEHLLLEPGVGVVVNTTPRGAADALAASVERAGAPARCALLDVVYDPWPTRLAQVWGGPVVGGAVMLLHQAARQVELMTGRAAPLAAMRAALPEQLLR